MSKKLALMVIFVLGFAVVASAQQVRINQNRTPLRAEPTPTSTALAFYQAGSALDILGLSDGWYKVRDPKTRQEGYILASLVDVLRGAAPSAPAETRPLPATEQVIPKAATPSAAPPKSSPPPIAQQKPVASGKPPVPAKPTLAFRGVADVGAVWMTASESFDAVAGTDMRVQYGGGLQVVNIWRRLYAEVAVGRSSLSGSRVFVYQGVVYDMGIPVSITLTPVDAGGGWRFPLGKRLHAYAGGGVTFMNYQEESDSADPDDNVSEVFTGFYTSAGVEFRLANWVHIRGEARLTTIADALGGDGVSADFGETNLGGIGVAVKVAIGR